MKVQAGHILEGTVVLIALYWLVTNATAFGNVINTGAYVTVGAARTLWGGQLNPRTTGAK